MPTAAFTTLGCKVNQYETQKILESFEQAGFAIVPFDSPADVYVINSCSVTSIAESKSRYTIRRASRNNPRAKVVVTGCAAQMSLIKSEALEGADLVVPNPEKLQTLVWLYKAHPELASRAVAEPAGRPSTVASGRTRATLKIQDGCSVHCSYCSIPHTRPGMTSKPASEVLSEAHRLAALGYKEIVLTGVLIGSYGPESGSQGPNFEELVESLAGVAGIERLRISSIEMPHVTERLIGLLSAGVVVPHLHVPLQSGDDAVLSDMNRRYRRADYLNLAERLYASVPDFSLTSDVMVGFPTESPQRFDSTLEVCRRARFLKAHVFRFSPRFGTPADSWGDPVGDLAKQDRARQVACLSAETGEAHRMRFLGRTMRVLVEGKTRSDSLLEGLTDNYLEVAFAGPESKRRQSAWVRIEEYRAGTLYGELAPEPNASLRPIPVGML